MKKLALLTIAFATVLTLFCRDFGRVWVTVPTKPIGPTQTWVGISDTYRTAATGEEYQSLHYVFDWNGSTETTNFAGSGETVGLPHAWSTQGVFSVKALAMDDANRTSPQWSDPLQVTVGADHAPSKPDAPLWESLGSLFCDSLVLWSKATDSDGDSVCIRFFCDADSNQNWNSGWRGPVPSGAIVYDTVRFTNGEAPYLLQAIACDWKHGRHGLVSDTSDPLYWIPPEPLGWRYPSSGSGAGWRYCAAIATLPGDELLIFPASSSESVYAFKDNGGDRPEVFTRILDPTTRPHPSDGPSLSSDHQHLYQPADDHRMYCLSASTDLSVLSHFPDDNAVVQDFTTPAVFQNYLYSARGDSLVCLRDNGGVLDLAWAYEDNAEVLGPPVISNDGSRLFFADDTGFFICVDNAGHEQWRSAVGGNVTTGGAIGDDGTVIVGREDGRLYGYGPADSTPVFSTAPLPAQTVGCPVIGYDGRIYTVRDDASVQAYPGSGTEQSPIWNVTPTPATGCGAAPCLAPDTTIIIHTSDDYLIALRLADGSVKWRLDLPGSGLRSPRYGTANSAAPTIGLRNIYVGGSNSGHFYAIGVDYDSYAIGLPNTPWPKFQHDISNSGCKGGTWFRP